MPTQRPATMGDHNSRLQFPSCRPARVGAWGSNVRTRSAKRQAEQVCGDSFHGNRPEGHSVCCSCLRKLHFPQCEDGENWIWLQYVRGLSIRGRTKRGTLLAFRSAYAGVPSGRLSTKRNEKC